MPSGMFLDYKFYDHSKGSTSNIINEIEEIKVHTNYTVETLKSDNLLVQLWLKAWEDH